MKMIPSFLLTVVFLLSFPEPGLAAKRDLEKLTPLNNDVAGWVIDEIYYAGDAESLMARINGGAPFYLEHGTREVLFQEYSNGKSYLSIELYKTESRESAGRLYANVHAATPEHLDGLGDMGRFDGSLVGSDLVEFQHKNYFVRLMISQGTNSKMTILKFARAISAKIDKQQL